ncbi:MAG: ATP-binding protein [Clostridiales bacterium]|nr:ATP-binding protein [Clostridiales bacterium]
MKENKQQEVINVLDNFGAVYLKGKDSGFGNNSAYLNSLSENFKDDSAHFFSLYRIDEITFQEKAPRKEALENVISSMNIIGYNFVYIIMGDENGVSFYYGAARDFSCEPEIEKSNAADVGDNILSPSLQGNFRGSKITCLKEGEKKKIINTINEFSSAEILEGVPGINKDDENFQSVDRLIDVMLGNKFALVITAKPMSQDMILKTQNQVFDLYDCLHPISKTSIQESSGQSESTSETTSTGTTESSSTNKSDTDQKGSSSSKGSSDSHTSNRSNSTGSSSETITGERNDRKKSTSENKSNGSSDTRGSSSTSSESESHSHTRGSSESHSTSNSSSSGGQTGTNTGSSTTLEIINKKIQEWIKYVDEVILPRIDYGLGRGMFISSSVIFGDELSLIKLENTIKSIYGGEAGNKMPLKAFPLDEDEKALAGKFQILTVSSEKDIKKEEAVRAVCSQIISEGNDAYLGSWMSAKELSLLAGLPQKEVVGMSLREEVDFGLNLPHIEPEKSVLLGHLIQSGVVFDGENGTLEKKVYYDRSYFDKHIFVTGVTGSGKTTTCQKLLLESNMNFMIIEPAKTEYRILSEKFDDLIVFTLGKENAAPFRLNPFEFFPGESITSRVDMIKGTMEASFDMEAAIPQLLEAAIYQCYEDAGWNISTNEHKLYSDPFADGVEAFPTLGYLEKCVSSVVMEQGFDDRLKDEYIGSIKARLKGLTVGAKGLMLNTPRSVSFTELLDKKVVFELENIKSGAEKSLIMGFILSDLSEAIKEKYSSSKGKPVGHITLVEEAHRLLSKYTPGDSMNKKQGVEMFADMLAEVRKYGESLIIADQIPDKLTPEVLKSTNTKIVHRIFAQDDKEAIGNTMALKDEQKEHLSYLETGTAIMMHPGLSKAIQIKVQQTEQNDTSRQPASDEKIRENTLRFYKKSCSRNIFPDSKSDKNKTGGNVLINFKNAYCRFVKHRTKENFDEFFESSSRLKKVLIVDSYELLVKIILTWYIDEELEQYGNEIEVSVKEFILTMFNNPENIRECIKNKKPCVNDFVDLVKYGL